LSWDREGLSIPSVPFIQFMGIAGALFGEGGVERHLIEGGIERHLIEG
jgi:hypothetical protein